MNCNMWRDSTREALEVRRETGEKEEEEMEGKRKQRAKDASKSVILVHLATSHFPADLLTPMAYTA